MPARDPARTLTDAEWGQLVGFRAGKTWEETAAQLGVGVKELSDCIYEGVEPNVLEKIRAAIRRHPVVKW